MKKRLSTVAVVLMVALFGGAQLTALPQIGVGMTAAGATLDGEGVGELSLTGALRLTPWMDLLLSGTAVHTIERSYEDAEGKTYQSEAAWIGLGLRPFLSLGERVEIGLPLKSSTGTVQFRYERPYREELPWDEEIIDRQTVAVYSGGLDAVVHLNNRWSLTAEGGGRVSSPVEVVVDFDRHALNSWYAGVGATYRIVTE